MAKAFLEANKERYEKFQNVMCLRTLFRLRCFVQQGFVMGWLTDACALSAAQNRRAGFFKLLPHNIHTKHAASLSLFRLQGVSGVRQPRAQLASSW